jgi:hypothetical protein
MTSKSNKVRADMIGKIPITLEGLQLAIQNTERLLSDSQKVSIPTKVALLEIGLEEVAKAWVILLSFEKDLFDKNEEQSDILLEAYHISKKFEKGIEELEHKKEEFFRKYDLSSLLIAFDTQKFSNHKEKIKFLSKFIGHIREIALPLVESSYSSDDLDKIINDVIGPYFQKNKPSDLKENLKAIYDIFNINDDELEYIVNLKEQGLYLNIQNGIYISPTSRVYETKTLENLLALLLIMAKAELILLNSVLEKLSVNISAEKMSK